MSSISNTGAADTAAVAAGAQPTSVQELDMDEFLKLMIAELQNQDPLDPLDNSEMLAQISQIREIGATDKLSETLTAVLAGQELTTASNIIGTEVEAMDDDGQTVRGVVNRISVDVDEQDRSERTLQAHIDSVAQGTTNAMLSDARLKFTAVHAGDQFDQVTIRFVNDDSVTAGNESVTFDATGGTLTFGIDDGRTTANDIVRALEGDVLASQAFTAEPVEEGDGDGLVSPAHTAVTAGGQGHVVKLDNIREILKPEN